MALPPWARLGRRGWQNTGERRPPFAIAPGAGQESVWDYPRPPRLVQDARLIRVALDEFTVAETRGALRVLETASPPTFYLPPADVDASMLRHASGESRCEWKGTACYLDVLTSERVVEQAGWSYPEPFDDFAAIRGYLSFYPGRVACFVDGERVRPQPGGFYGGWVTDEIVGPFKGEPGTGGW